MTNLEAYDKAKALCAERGWNATYWALEEDGYDPATDFVALLEKWSKD